MCIRDRGEKVKLKSYFVNLAHGLKPMATLKIEINGKEYEESSGGDEMCIRDSNDVLYW